MKALILAAGLGTRLQPLTQNVPKALVEVQGVTLLEHAVRKMKHAGVDEIVVNVHHFADQVINFIENHDFGIKISVSDERSALLNTGGGVWHAREYLQNSGHFFVYNVDVICDIDLRKLIDYHLKNNNLATLAIQQRESSRKLLFDKNSWQLVGWLGKLSNQFRWVDKPLVGFYEMAFSGIQVLSDRIFGQISERGSFSSIDMYLRLARQQKVSGFPFSSCYWYDAGKISVIEELNHSKIKF